MPTTYTDIERILGDPAFSDSDKEVVRWQYRLTGDFETALWGAIKAADDGNLARLARAFPNHVAGYLAWTRGNLGGRLRAAGLEI